MRAKRYPPSRDRRDIGQVVSPIEKMMAAREAMIPAGRVGEGNDIADVVVFLASDAARYINGANIPVDGGVTKALLALMPIPTANGELDTTLGQLGLRP